jgi:hypothetical protein
MAKTGMTGWVEKACAIAGIGIASTLNLSSTSWSQSEDNIRSTKLAPIDCDFYYGSYKMAEQWDRFIQGPVAQEALELPVVERLSNQFRSQWSNREGELANVRFFWDNGSVKALLSFLQELASKDVFILGDKGITPWLEASSQLNDEIGQLVATSQPNAEEVPKLIVLNWIKTFEKLNLPTLMMGARCDDEEAALTNIDFLEAPFTFGLSPELQPYLKEFKRIDDSRGNRLQWVLKGSMIPWDDIPPNPVFDDEVKEKLRQALSNKSITLTVGLFDGNFVLGMGATPESIMALGKGKSILEHPDARPVRDAITRDLTSFAYVSDAFAQANFKAYYKNFFSRTAISNALQAMNVFQGNPEFRKFFEATVKDLQWTDDEIAKHVPEFKGVTSLAFMTDDGWERHDHYRTKDVLADSSAPLTSLQHVGGTPLLMVATKLQDHPEYFRTARRIVQRWKARFDIALEMDWKDNAVGVETDQIKKWSTLVWPLVARAADAWEKKFLPAMTGEHTIVMSGGNLASKQWAKDMPMAPDPLPLPEIATISGIKDESLFKSGIEDLLDICNDVVKIVREQDPGSIPSGYQVPRPIKISSTLGDKYGYPIPKECPVPVDMVPQGLLSGAYLYCTYSDKQSESLAKVSALDVGQPMIDAQANQSTASYVHVGKLFAFVRPWFRYAVTEGLESLDDNVFNEALDDPYADYDITGRELLSIWNVLSRIGEFSSSTTSLPSGETRVRSVYRRNSDASR